MRETKQQSFGDFFLADDGWHYWLSITAIILTMIFVILVVALLVVITKGLAIPLFALAGPGYIIWRYRQYSRAKNRSR